MFCDYAVAFQEKRSMKRPYLVLLQYNLPQKLPTAKTKYETHLEAIKCLSQNKSNFQASALIMTPHWRGNIIQEGSQMNMGFLVIKTKDNCHSLFNLLCTVHTQKIHMCCVRNLSLIQKFLNQIVFRIDLKHSYTLK